VSTSFASNAYLNLNSHPNSTRNSNPK
jgi:hypothetical protein